MPLSEFIHLRSRSLYSIASGAIKVEELINKALEEKMPALALTDYNNLFGSMEFSLSALENGLQPIMGSLLSLNIDYGQKDFNHKNLNLEILVLVQNDKGWKNLSYLLSDSYFKFKKEGKQSVSFNDIIEMNEGLIVLSGGNNSPINYLIKKNKLKEAEDLILKFKDCFGDRFYIELMRMNGKRLDKEERKLIDFAYKLNVPMVATNDIYFLNPSMEEAQDCLMCIAEGKTVENLDRNKLNQEYCFKSSEQMLSLFKDIPEALENTLNIAKRCHFILEERPPSLPKVLSENNISENKMLELEACKGLKIRLASLEKNTSNSIEQLNIYKNRLNYELKVIHDMGYSGYFLIVSDFINWSKKKNIPVGPGRGSGAGSLVAWAVGITNIDPMKYGLLFERFLNPERVSMPDFDIDFCQSRREEVIEYVRNKYGLDNVAQIITFGSLQARGVIRDVGRVLDINFSRIDKIAKLIPSNPGNPTTLNEAISGDKSIRESIKTDEDISKLFELGLKLEGLYRNVSTHAAGLVIADKPIKDTVPLYYDSKSEIPATQYTMKYIEKSGFVKFDFLGLKTLTVLNDTKKLLEENGIKVDLDRINFDDKKTYSLLSSGHTTGVFQLESIGMRDVLRKLLPDRFEDIVAVVALFRPGPMENIPLYIDRKHNKVLTEYPHPLLEAMLKETFGIMIYQEQVMEAARIISGFTLGAADLLRRAMGKKIKSEMEAQRRNFTEGASKNGLTKENAKDIFEQIEKFAGYGFNKSHAAAYAYISYQTAWLKSNYPVEYLAALLNSETDNLEKMHIIKLELDRLNIKLYSPSINLSSAFFSVHKDKKSKLYIRCGLSNIKNIGTSLANLIVEERKKNGEYRNVLNFSKRLDPKHINKRQIQYLATSGALDELELQRWDLFDSATYVMQLSNTAYNDRINNQFSLFSNEEEDKRNIIFPKSTPWLTEDTLLKEFHSLGFFASSHPLSNHWDLLRKLKINESKEILINKTSGKNFELAGFVIKKDTINTSRGKVFNCTFSDPTGLFELRFYENFNIDNDLNVELGKSYFVRAIHKLDNDSRMRLSMVKCSLLNDLMSKLVKKYKIYINNDLNIKQLKLLLDNSGNGNTKINFIINNTELFSGYNINHSSSLLSEIRSMNGVGFIEEII